jgi:hypothetical protein
VSIEAKYLDTKSCAECHEMIHYEHMTSMHSKSSLFKDEFHGKIKNITTPEKYSCALCHTPAATNLRAIMDGKEQPSSTNKRETDGVSCFYCHQITKVLVTKHRNINFYAYAENTKPKFFGNLDNVDNSDKHKSSSANNIYKNSQICMGCHGKKFNKHSVEICYGYNDVDETSDCIGCHMPKFPGGVTKLNKRGRSQYTSHEFLGVRSDIMVKKAVKLKLKQINSNSIELTIKNKMGHNIIMQPMRLKYVKTTISRDGKIIWQNFKDNPMEDNQATFTRLFKDDMDKDVYPPFATKKSYDNNIRAKSSKSIIYKVPKLQKGDKITSQWISYVIRPSLAEVLKIEDKDTTKRYIGFSTTLIVTGLDN